MRWQMLLTNEMAQGKIRFMDRPSAKGYVRGKVDLATLLYKGLTTNFFRSTYAIGTLEQNARAD